MIEKSDESVIESVEDCAQVESFVDLALLVHTLEEAEELSVDLVDEILVGLLKGPALVDFENALVVAALHIHQGLEYLHPDRVILGHHLECSFGGNH